MSLRFAQVIHTYPNYRACEVVMVDNGQRFQNVTFLHDYVSSNSGIWMSHGVERPASEQDAGGLMSDETLIRSVLAACIMMSGRPYIVGFQPHPMSQLMFIKEEQNRDIYRHPAGTIATVQKAGNLEFSHSGGAFIRIARDSDTTPADRHEDLTPLCANGNWTLPRNEPVTITVCTGDQGAAAVKLRVRPNGDTDIMSSGNLRVRYAQDAVIEVGGNAQITVAGDATATVGGNLDARAMNDATVTAGNSAHLLALGNGYMASAGPALVGSLDELTLEAPRIKIVTGELDVTAGQVGIAAGSIGMEAGSIGMQAGTVGMTGSVGVAGTLGVAGMLGVEGTVGVVGAVGVVGLVEAAAFLEAVGFPGPPGFGGFGGGGGGSFGGVAAEVALANAQRGEGQADLAAARANIEAAVTEASETSLEAVGWGDPDNLGLGGEPAPDVP